ncbi:MAG: cation:proton antiporter [Candidatus Micrarchaeota archaeon]
MTDLFAQLGWVLVFYMLGTIIATRLKQPAAIGLIISGVLIGPSLFGLVDQTDLISNIAEIGAALLLFAIGLEFSLSKLIHYKLKIIAIATIKLAVIYLATYELALFLGIDSITALYLGAILSITSTAIMVKIIQNSNLMHKEEIPLLIGSLIIEDLFAVFLLTFFSALNAGNNLSSLSLFYSISQAIVILGIVYLVLTKIIERTVNWITQQAKEEGILLAIALGLGIGMSAIAQYLNLSPAIGAFLAGSLVSHLQKKDELEKQITPFILASSSVFFLSIGLMVKLDSILQNWSIILIFVIANLLLKFTATSASTFLNGFTSRSAIFSGVAMLSVGEFSLLIAKQAEGTSIDLVSLTSALVLTSALANSFLIKRHEIIHTLTYKLVPESVKNAGRNLAKKMVTATNVVDYSFELLKTLATMLKNATLLLAGIATTILLLLVSRNQNITLEHQTISLNLILLIIGGCIIAFFTYKIIRTTKELLLKLANETKHNKQAINSIVPFLMLVFFAIATPFVLSILNISTSLSELGAIIITLLLLAVFFYSGRKENEPILFK